MTCQEKRQASMCKTTTREDLCHLWNICFRFHMPRSVYIWTSNITTIYLETSSGSVYTQREGFTAHKAAWQNETHTSTAGRRGNWIRDRASLMWWSVIEFGLRWVLPRYIVMGSD